MASRNTLFDCNRGLRPSARVLAAVLLCLLAARHSPAIRAAWFFQPSATMGLGYEENPNLTQSDRINSMRYHIAASALGGGRTERSQILFGLKADALRYPGNGSLNSDDLSARVDAAYRLTELDFVDLQGTYDRTTSQTSELTTTGNIQGNVPLNTYTLRPSWTHQLTERASVSLGYAYTSARYQQNSTNLINYNQQEIRASLGYRLTERATFDGSLTTVFYNPRKSGSVEPGAASSSTNAQSYTGYAATLGLSYAISETLAARVFVGPEQIKSESNDGQTGGQGTSMSATYGISLSRQFERSELDLALESGAVPTGGGQPLSQNKLTVSYSYALTPMLRITIPASFYRNETLDLGDTSTTGQRIFLETEPRLSWRLSPDLYLRASYRYQYQRYQQSGETADSHAVFLSLSYVWPTESAAIPRPSAP